jgi:hypothetical protein
MARLFSALSTLAVALWAGGLWFAGAVVAPLLFRAAPDRQVAGALAGQMFTLLAWTGLGCGFYILIHAVARTGPAALKTGLFWVVAAMLVLTAAGQFGVQPILATLKAEALPREVMESVLRDRFAAWHGVASILYLIQALLALPMVLLAVRAPAR